MKKGKKGTSCFMLLWCVLAFSPMAVKAQEATVGALSLNVEQLFELVDQNNPGLKVSRKSIEVAEQNVKIAQNNKLPNASTSISGYYLSDVDIFSTKFKKQFTQDMPHFGNSLSVEANQLIWKGGQVNESIRLAKYQVEVAQLQYSSAEQEARLAALGYYLDLFKLYNQSKVYEQNIILAEQRLANIMKFEEQGMVTRNDVIRGELMVSNLNLSKLTIDNNILILNRQLNVAIGLPESTVIVPTEDILAVSMMKEQEEFYQNTALINNTSILLTKKVVDINESALKITKKNGYPSLAAFAGNTMQRPLTSTTPVLDMYYNSWNAGVGLSFNIGSLWKNGREVEMKKMEVEKSRAQQEEVTAYIGVGIKSAYIKHNEAMVQNSALETNKNLADENYRIMEKKYNNQLALIIDLLDAANAKLDAELQYANSEVNIIYAYYKLLKETGKI